MSEGRSVEQWLSLAGSVAAPAGAVTALLFYFGYASTRAKYEYFGVDVDVVGLGRPDARHNRGITGVKFLPPFVRHDGRSAPAATRHVRTAGSRAVAEPEPMAARSPATPWPMHEVGVGQAE